MPSTFSYQWDTPAYKGKTEFNTGLFINGQFVDGSNKTTIDVVNPTNGKVITSISEGVEKDVDLAVEAAQKAFETTWGLNVSGSQRSELLWKLATLMEQHHEELAAIEATDNGKTFAWAKGTDVAFSINVIKYFAGWADKITGQTIETDERKLIYTRHEPIGVVGQIIPWNFPLLMLAWKIGPALATGNTIVLKPSEFTPLTAIRMCSLIQEAGFPPGVVNIVTGYGNTVGAAISSHPKIEKVAFTGSTLVGRKIMDSSGTTAKHAALALSGIYDEFLKRFTAKAAAIRVGDPFGVEVDQGPQVSQIQYDRIMGYIDSGKADGATVHLGGKRHGQEGYFIEPTIFTDVKPDMKIVREEIFGPVGVLIKFEDEADVIRQANDTVYGLAAA
ncbi:hypothetical protein E4U52_001070, partial [Claviceps spartinae]